MSRDYNGRFTDPEKRRDGKGNLIAGIIMAPLSFVSGLTFLFLPLSAFFFWRHYRNFRHNELLNHFREYANRLGIRERVTVSELADTFGRAKDVVRKELKRMLGKNYFGEGAYFDAGGDMLFCPLPREDGRNTKWADVAMELLHTLRGDYESAADAEYETESKRRYRHDRTFSENYRQRTEQRKKQAAPEPKPDPKPEPKPEKQAAGGAKSYAEEMERTLNALYDLNERIGDEGVSRRIDRIGALTGSIFRVVIEKPERESDVRRFMTYYLPMTLKLLQSYSLMEAQTYQGENIVASRKKIENTLDMLIQAFEQLLDHLFQNDAMDISADVQVLETMMAGDGLTDKGRMKL